MLKPILFLITAVGGFGCGSSGNADTFGFPNGEPPATTVQFKGACVAGDCQFAPYDKWHSGAVTTCKYDGTKLELRSDNIPNGATSFTFRFVVGNSPSITLDPATTVVDWSLPDGGSALMWMNKKDVATKSSGSVTFQRCGDEVAGKFELHKLCEYHGCATVPWTADVVGAFRCKPSMALPCGL